MKKMHSLVKASQLKKDGRYIMTGIEEIDKLVGRLEGGNTYLFYGDEEFIDELVHRLMVRAAGEGKVAYMNNTDYHTAKTLLDLDRIAFYAKREGVEPSHVMKKVFFGAAYNELRQPLVAEALAERIDKDCIMLIMHNTTRFLADSKDKRSTLEAMDISVSKLWHKAMQNGLIVVITCDTAMMQNENARLPVPAGSSLLRQIARVSVFFRRVQDGLYAATLVKHPEKKIPESAAISYAEGDAIMGRMTPSFRQVYQSLLERLRNNYLPLLRNEKERRAFERLVSDAWDKEHAAMANSQLPLVLDAMNLTANVHNSAEIEKLAEEVRELKAAVEELKSLVQKQKDNPDKG
ncbi:MAG: hypothetical protein QXX17_03050 [Conexivisphaerales archaeon]